MINIVGCCITGFLSIILMIVIFIAYTVHITYEEIDNYGNFTIRKYKDRYYACIMGNVLIKFFRRTLHGGNCGDCYDQFNLSYIPDAWYNIEQLKNYIDTEGYKLIQNKEINMNFKNNTIDNALNKKKQVEELEQRLIKEKETMNQMKNIAKKDLEWILGE